MKLFALLAAKIAVSAQSSAETVAADDVCYSNGEEVACNGLARAGRPSASDDGDRAIGTERRYVDLQEITKKIWKLAGHTGRNRFDERKYWAYGCHCYLLGDRPLTEMGQGAPKDGLDNKCKAYKDCQKCVREKHGNECIGEFKKYTWKYASRRAVFESSNAEGSCERELFQCDLQFAKDTLLMKDTFNEEYHAFWSTLPNGFDNRDPDNCPSNGGVPVEHQCCGGYDREYHWIGLNKKQCCPINDGLSGTVKSIDESC